MISVCIATHNGEKHIKHQLDSILSQLCERDEVVVSDDGSTDATLSIIEEMADERIKIYHYAQPSKTMHSHEYVCRNFENALKHAKGEYIFLSDQDDEWLPDKVEVCIQDLKEHDLVLHEFMHIDENENIINSHHYNGTFRPKNYFLRKGKHFGCAMAFRRKVLDYVLPFPKYLVLHDYWIGILVETLGNFYYEERPLIKYRIHLQNTSRTKNSLKFKFSYRVVTLWYVLRRVCRYKKSLYSNLIQHIL